MISGREAIQLALLSEDVPQTSATDPLDGHGEYLLHEGDVVRLGVPAPFRNSFLREKRKKDAVELLIMELLNKDHRSKKTYYFKGRSFIQRFHCISCPSFMGKYLCTTKMMVGSTKILL